MKLARASTDHQRNALKLAMKRQIKACAGQESAASITRVGPQTLSDYANAANDRYRDIQCPVDVLLDLTLDGGPVALVELCRLSGGVFVPLPAVGAGSDWAREIGDVAREAGQAVSRLCEALSTGGTITVDESRDMDLRREVKEAIEALAAVDMHLQHLEETDDKPARAGA
ncbi:hypothetical protein [Breoghania sp. L-A4]|uniref:hypothetical protein n=1 Tax=Breoghania sp. L-A4 TaxID=2304600 RepID=UPI000E35D916|nr:hypothetical protein [Breoghania sp. L-A4]AXS39782.1 hypothetical protein D1F64_06605 [Breoghania sp. L-A4]AXS40990.1 hypothetical protein D1F64_14340 [Breoghania sp. L-A4]